MVNIPTLSFCITCKNRFHQISQTLKRNLDDNRLHERFIEFILVDFGSTDDLRRWILSDFSKDLSSSYLRYYYTDELPYWHASIAKNTTHLLARNDIVVNLDCDNYTGYLGGQFVINQFFNYYMDIIFHQYRGSNNDGSFGRISMLRKYFHKIGGYDESFQPMGFQDNDLILRLMALGLSYTLSNDNKYNNALFNTKSEGLEYTNTSINYSTMSNDNRNLSSKHLSEGYIIANNGIYGIKNKLFDHKGKQYNLGNL